MADYDEYQRLAAEKEAQHEANANPNSHSSFFEKKAGKLRGQIELSTENDLEGVHVPQTRSDDQVRRSIKRGTQISQAVEDALVNRVQAPTGVNLMKVNFQEFQRIRKDPNFESFAQYAHNILNYTDGRPRPKPLRPFVQNEVGMYRGQIVCLDRMPDDSPRGDIPYVQVPVQLEAEPDPFPSSVIYVPEKTVIAGPGETVSVTKTLEGKINNISLQLTVEDGGKK